MNNQRNDYTYEWYEKPFVFILNIIARLLHWDASHVATMADEGKKQQGFEIKDFFEKKTSTSVVTITLIGLLSSLPNELQKVKEAINNGIYTPQFDGRGTTIDDDVVLVFQIETMEGAMYGAAFLDFYEPYSLNECVWLTELSQKVDYSLSRDYIYYPA